MRLLRLRLRNFRGVQDRTVSFVQRGVTVVAGQNEVGKSSLVEALDLLLEKPDSSRDQSVRAVCPTHADAGPEVEAEITTGAFHFTYRKRWHRRPETVLTVTAPHRESLTGREAHQRVQAILADTLDAQLWKALRVTQTGPPGQAALRDSAVLTRALDLAAGGSSADTSGDDLCARVKAEYDTYFTPRQQKPRGDYATAIKAFDASAATLAERTEILATIARDVEEHGRLSRELADLQESERRHEPALARLRESWQELEDRVRQVDHLQEQAHSAALEADLAAQALDERDQLLTRIRADEELLDRLRSDHDQQAAELEQARGHATAAEQALTDRHTGAERAAVLAARAAEDLDHLRDRAERSALAGRRSRAHAAAEEITAAQTELAATRVDRVLLAGLQEAADQADRAEIELAAATSTLEIEALAAVELHVDGEPVPLDAGAHVVRQLDGAGELTLPGVVRIRLVPGSSEGDLRRAATTARDAYRALCDQAGVSDLAAARTAVDRRDEVERTLRTLRDTLTRELDGGTLDHLDTAHARLADRVDGYERDRPAEPPLPVDLDAARAAATVATRQHTELRNALDAARARAEDCAAHVRDADTRLRLSTQRITDADEQAAGRRAHLATARSKDTDEELHTRATAAAARASTITDRWKDAADALAADNPASVRAQLDAALATGTRLRTDLDECRSALAEARGRLSRTAGAQEAHDEAERAHQAAEHTLDGLHRRARAAALLHETLERHREETRRSYVAPFRRELVRLASVVFGPDLDIEVDDNLQMTSRTLDGVTVPFDGLSGGAKEQLGLCARLACAALVDEHDGVPVVIDDALGYSDTTRLARLSAVFDLLAERSQVIVLTCQPERYEKIGTAEVVPLTPSTTPRSETDEPA